MSVIQSGVWNADIKLTGPAVAEAVASIAPLLRDHPVMQARLSGEPK